MQALYVSVADFKKLVGLGRSRIYEMLARGKLRGIKVGTRTLVDMDHAREFFASQPKVNFSYVGKRAA